MGIPWEAGEQHRLKEPLSRSERGLSEISGGRRYWFRCDSCKKSMTGGNKNSPPNCPKCGRRMRFEKEW